MADPTTTNLTDEERQRLLASASQPIIPSLHSIPPLPATQQANLMSGTKVAPQVGKEMFAAGMPSVSAAPGTADYGAQRQEKLDYEKMHPWGSPVSAQPGTWGKIGHVASRIGNIAGDILAPATMANIPGTDLNKQREAAQNAKWINLGSENQLRGAETEKAKADVPLEGALTDEAEAKAEALRNPQSKEKEEEWTTVPGVQGPNGEPVQQEKHSGQMRISPLAGASVTEKQQRPEAPHTVEMGNRTYQYDPASGKWNDIGPMKSPASEPGSYVPVPDPTDPIHKIVGWVDPKSGHYKSLASIPGMGGNAEIKPTGQEASREGQAAVVSRAADGLIATIQAHRDKLGNTGAIIQSAFLGTPLADPVQAQLATELASFAALNPAMHGFRGQDALREFEKIIGGIPKNPDALISSINAIKKTAGYFNPNQQPETGGGGKGPSVGTVEGGYRFKGGNPADKNNWERAQ